MFYAVVLCFIPAVGGGGGGEVPSDGGERGPLCSFSGFLRFVSLIGATLLLRFGDGWFWPCGCLVGFVRHSFCVAL